MLSPMLMLGCDSEQPDELSAITHEGAGTFSCLKNGSVWLAKCRSILGDESWCAGGTEHFFDDYFQIFGIGKESVSIDIYIKEPVLPNEFLVNNDSTLFIEWAGNRALSGRVIISHFDTTRKIVAGLFNFIVVDANTQDTIRFTDGRFDLQYE